MNGSHRLQHFAMLDVARGSCDETFYGLRATLRAAKHLGHHKARLHVVQREKRIEVGPRNAWRRILKAVLLGARLWRRALVIDVAILPFEVAAVALCLGRHDPLRRR